MIPIRYNSFHLANLIAILFGSILALWIVAVNAFESFSSAQAAATLCSLSQCPVVPLQADDGRVKVETVGNAEMVFEHARDACTPADIPDAPARAFRDASGSVNLFAAHGATTTFRYIGQSLNTVKHICNVVMRPTGNTDYDAASYHEWIVSPYTLDGTTVYSLVHNEWYPTLIDKKCVWGWVNSITLVVSRDGGAHFSHPPDYKIRLPAVPWSPSFTCTNPRPNDAKYGSFEPTNIVFKDGYYYAMFYQQEDPIAAPKGNVLGNCLMRTQDLAYGSSWQVWDRKGWAPALATPSCGFISPQTLQRGFIKSISYNTYLQAYVGLATVNTAGVLGIGYTLSQDLITWSKPVLLLRDLNVPQGKVAYPALLDPASASRNFETSGREPIST